MNKENSGQQEIQAKGESPISSRGELDNSEYAKKGLSTHNPADKCSRCGKIEKLDHGLCRECSYIQECEEGWYF